MSGRRGWQGLLGSGECSGIGNRECKRSLILRGPLYIERGIGLEFVAGSSQVHKCGKNAAHRISDYMRLTCLLHIYYMRPIGAL